MTTFCYIVAVRNIIVNAISLALAGSQFTYNGFAVAASHIPVQKIEDPASQKGKCWVISGGLDDSDRKTREGIPPFVTRELSIQIAYQETNIAVDDIQTLDNRLLLREQIMDVVKDADYSGYPDYHFLWLRNETLKDENGLPFHYYMLREAATFETYFTAHFKVPHQ